MFIFILHETIYTLVFLIINIGMLQADIPHLDRDFPSTNNVTFVNDRTLL